jgi:hypothetical protein
VAGDPDVTRRRPNRLALDAHRRRRHVDADAWDCHLHADLRQGELRCQRQYQE